MNKMKKRIVALSTAFVMAFALVAALVPATAEAAEGDQQIASVDVKVTPPTVGLPLATNDDGNGDVEVNEGENYYVSNWGYYGDDGSKLYGNPCEAGKVYCATFTLTARKGFVFKNNCTKNIINTVTGEKVDYSTISTDPDGKFMTIQAMVRPVGGDTPAPQPAVNPDTPYDVVPDSEPAPTPTKTASKASAAKAKTADPVPYAAVAVLVAGVAAVSAVVIRRRRNF